jgi:hypothetical protein
MAVATVWQPLTPHRAYHYGSNTILYVRLQGPSWNPYAHYPDGVHGSRML